MRFHGLVFVVFVSVADSGLVFSLGGLRCCGCLVFIVCFVYVCMFVDCFTFW